jgi:isopenicillin-N N-acyltransferase like protein
LIELETHRAAKGVGEVGLDTQKTRMFPIVELSGNAFERGFAHGVQARTRIAGSIRNYSALFERCDLSWKDAQERADEFREIIIGCGEVYDEIDGIAAGSGYRIQEILALNCRTELMPPTFFTSAANSSAGRSVDVGECTSFAVNGTRCADGATRIGQTWDWMGLQRDNVVILRTKCREKLPDFVTVTEAGMVAKIGLNAHGLAIGLNILRAINDRSEIGMPVHIFQRLALDLDSVDRVIDLAKTLRFSGSSNAMLGDANGRIVSLEYSPNGVAVIEGDQGAVAHTNHFCDMALVKHQVPLEQMLSTELRLDRAQQHITGWPDRVTTRNLTTLLRDDQGHKGSEKLSAICRAPDRSLPPELQIETVLGIIINCNAREMLIAPGLPTKVEFASVAL